MQRLEGVFRYIDDLIIFSNGSKTEHLLLIKKVLLCLHQAGLCINLQKSEFFKSKIAFLGKVLDANTCKPLPRHIAALQNFPPPADINSCMRLLGILNRMSGFIPFYSTKVEEICKLLRKNAFHWEERHTNILNELKDSLTERTSKFHVDWTECIYLSKDASDTSYAAVAWQTTIYKRSDLPALKQRLTDRQQANIR
jgi:hypothetical protein